MSAANAYPELPVVPYVHTSINEKDVFAYIATLNYPDAVKSAAYAIFQNESGHGASGVNNNYGGVQADGNRVSGVGSNKIIATTVKVDNSGATRRFCVFDRWQSSIDVLVDRVSHRGMYLGATAVPYSNLSVDSTQNFARAYQKEWVSGNKYVEPSSDTLYTMSQLYSKALGLFNTSSQKKK